MYDLVDRPFENEQVKEEIDDITNAQQRAAEMGGVLVTEFDMNFLPRLEELEGVERSTYRSGNGSGLMFDWTCEFGAVEALPDAPFGVAVVIPSPGAQLPKSLQDIKMWSAGEAVLDYSNRTITIQNGDTVITFSSVNVAGSDWTMLKEINEALLERNAGVLVWKLSGVVSDPHIQHLYPDGKVPLIRNEHAQATVTGYATTMTNWNAELVYAGLVAHKTALESLHATLMQRKSLSLDGAPVVPGGHFLVEVVPMPDYGLIHAALICDAALPGKWSPQDERAYALVFKQPDRESADIDALLESAVLLRLREVLPHAVKDEWAHELFFRGSQRGLIDRLKTDGDCIAGASIHLDKDWTALLSDLLTEAILTV